jgi:predicted AAA+ superfamily ATPase
MEVLTLWPLSQGEILGRREGFIAAAFGGDAPVCEGPAETRTDLIDLALRGGYPEVLGRKESARRHAWFRSYVTTILQRDVRDIAQIGGIAELPRLLSVLAARSSSLVNIAEMSRALGLPHTTLTRYLALLESAFLLRRIPAWAGSRARRVIKTPRLLIPDTGLLGHLAGLTASRLIEDPTAVGPLFESLVASELLKQLAWNDTRAELFHFRTHAGREVDLVLEGDDGRVVGIEVKAAASVGGPDLKGLEALREVAGKRFHRGIVLYTGSETLPFGAGIWALPLSAVWRMRAPGEKRPR